MNLSDKLRPAHSARNTTPPSAADEVCSKALEEFLDEVDPLQTAEELGLREDILVHLRKLTAEWVQWVSMTKAGVPEEDAKPGRIFLSGSYRLNVAQKGADIDTVLVAPMHVRREDFFSEEENGLLARLRAEPNVTHVYPISTASVPLIEVIWSGIELDVLFASLQQAEVPTEAEELLDDSLLLQLDPASVQSLNGPRVTELLVKLVPTARYQSFRVLLRTLRYWAKVRGIYSNKLGFLGGVNFAILAAFAFQLWPTISTSRGLSHLFYILSNWKWPKPIRLCHPYTVEGVGANFPKAWDPNDPKSCGRMPIITPAFPNINSSANVTPSTLKVMKREIERAYKEVSLILKKGNECVKDDWASLFKPSDFFLRFRMYVSIVARAPDPESLKAWGSFVESRIRKFVETLETMRFPFYEIFPYPKSYDVLPNAESDDEEQRKFGKRWFIGLRVDSVIARTRNYSHSTINLESAVTQFTNNLNSQFTYVSANLVDGQTLDVSVLKFKDLIRFFPQFYPEGEREAFIKHQEIFISMQKDIERSRTLEARNGTTNVNALDEQEDEFATNGRSNKPSGEDNETQLNLMRRRQRDILDLTEVEMLPSKMPRIQGSLSAPAIKNNNISESSSFRPPTLRVNVI